MAALMILCNLKNKRSEGSGQILDGLVGNKSPHGSKRALML